MKVEAGKEVKWWLGEKGTISHPRAQVRLVMDEEEEWVEEYEEVEWGVVLETSDEYEEGDEDDEEEWKDNWEEEWKVQQKKDLDDDDRKVKSKEWEQYDEAEWSKQEEWQQYDPAEWGKVNHCEEQRFPDNHDDMNEVEMEDDLRVETGHCESCDAQHDNSEFEDNHDYQDNKDSKDQDDSKPVQQDNAWSRDQNNVESSQNDAHAGNKDDIWAEDKDDA